MTAENRDDLRLAVLLGAFADEVLETMTTLLHGDDALSRARRDIQDVAEREKRKLEREIWLEQAASFEVTEEKPE